MALKGRLLPRLVGIFCLAWAGLASADDYTRQWGPTIGSAMPLLHAADQAGVNRTLTDLSGDQGLLLFMNRSADW